MPRHHRRILFEYDDDHGACDPWYGCSSPPYTPSPTPTPSPSPRPSDWSFLILPVPGCAPAPSPDRQPAAGRRNQGPTNSYPPPAGAATGGDGHHRRFVTNVLVAAAALAFLSLILFGVSVAVRRRQIRRRRQALLATAPAATTNVGNDDPDGGGGGGGGGVVHHVWYIRTVGLDQAAIDSIAATRYRAGAAGLLGAADCSVCLGEFSDGELLRLLPKCGHAFHVPCIDTWLRAHVNCPLCRSDVIDTAATVDADPAADPDANANAAAEQLAAASDSTLEHEEEDEDNNQEAPHVEEDQHEQRLGSPEPLPLPQPPCPLPRNMRRAASMDAAMVSAAADVTALDRLPEAAPEGEQGDREKDPSTETPAPAGPPRFFFSRHCRARSSVLPL
ncbi:hypothetical protein ACQ4PT_024951 [Festuca glaucescens]